MLRLLWDWALFPLRLAAALLRFVLLLPVPRRVPAWVELELEGSLLWRIPPRRRRAWFLPESKPHPSLEAIGDVLDELAREKGVRGVVVKLGAFEASAARLDALRERLARLREAGKEVVVYAKQASTHDCMLLAEATRAVLAPGSPVLLAGFAATTTSLRDALDKLGVVPEFFRRGRFKTAPERFTERSVTPEQKLVIDAILDEHHRRLVGALARRTGGDEEKARQLVDGGPYTASAAKQAGLVDELWYPDELAKRLAREGEKKARIAPPVHLRLSRRWLLRPPRLPSLPPVAVVPISGLIKGGKSFRWPGGTHMAGADSVTEALDEVRRTRRVKAVVVVIDSRGGSAPASELMWRAVRRCSETKPTVAYVDEVAASGGYFAAAGARRIVAAPLSLVGSIGVFAGRFDARPLLARLGVHQEVFLRGAHAGILAPAHELTDDERVHLDREIEDTYEEFVARVAEGRGRTPDEIRAVAEGRVFVASQAPNVLVDELGGFPAALGWVCREAGLDPAKARVRIVEHAGYRPDLRELLALGREWAVAHPLLVWPDLIEVR